MLKYAHPGSYNQYAYNWWKDIILILMQIYSNASK